MPLSPAPPIKGSLLADFETTKSLEVFEALVLRYSPMVLGICRRILQSSDAEDAQAVFVLLWQKAGQIKDGVAVSAWLHRTACNVCCNVVRSRLSRTRHEQHAGLDSKTMSREPAYEMQLAELNKILNEEVNELPDKWRIPFVLFHFENRSIAEIAVAVGSNIPTVGAWLQRSCVRLAERLRRRGVTVGSLFTLVTEQRRPLFPNRRGLPHNRCARHPAGMLILGTCLNWPRMSHPPRLLLLSLRSALFRPDSNTTQRNLTYLCN